MKKHLKSFFEGIEEGLHWTPVGLLTVPLWAFRHKRTDFWGFSNGAVIGVWLAIIIISISES